MTNEEIVRAAIADHLGVPIERVVDDAVLTDDLGADSLDPIEICLALEEKLGIEIEDEDEAKLLSVRDWIDHIEKLKA